MSLSSYGRISTAVGALCAGWLFAVAPSEAQTPQRTPEPPAGATFACDDGGKMVLTFADTGDGISAMVWLRGATYQLANLPPEPGPARIVWSDGDHSLTWSPGVQLMWMSSETHLMCGRSGHKH